MPKNTVFTDTVAQMGGALNGDYLWSTSGNWSDGPPVDGEGDNVSTGVAGVDDIATLVLNDLSLTTAAATVDVIGSELTIANLAGVTGSGVTADAEAAHAQVTVTIDAVAGTGANYVANGAEATLIDNAASETGNTYTAMNGGVVELAAAPAANSTLEYSGGGTIDLLDPQAKQGVAVKGLANGDVLEVPGTLVTQVVFGATSLTVSTNAGTYQFTNVTYDGTVNSYESAAGSSTNTVAITFGVTDTFSQNVAAGEPPALAGQFLWSNADNWDLKNVPANKQNVTTAVVGYDDIDSLTLNKLTLSTELADVQVTGTALDVGTVAAPAGGSLIADSTELGEAVTVTIGATSGTDATYGADGEHARLVDHATTDTGNTYSVANGGVVTLAAVPTGSSTLEYSDASTGTFALSNLDGTVTAAVKNLQVGDVMELPGTLVSDIVFGANSLDITTDAGTYSFNNVSFDGTVDGYTDAVDPQTGLVAITFGASDTFQQNTINESAPLNGDYLWSESTNWESGVVPDTDAIVTTAVSGYDNIGSLTLKKLTLSMGVAGVHVTGTDLDVALIVTPDGGSLIADSTELNTPVTVTIDATRGSAATYGADGAGASFLDKASTDSGNAYTVDDGGAVSITAAPSDQSTLDYAGQGTFSLLHPAASNGVHIENLGIGDSLAVPGGTVDAVIIGSSGVEITTDQGTFDFNNVSFAGGDKPTSYSTETGPGGLVDVSFGGGNDTFSDPVVGDTFSRDDVWSDEANWDQGVPTNGDGVTQIGEANDDIASLSLGTLALTPTSADTYDGFLTIEAGSHLSVNELDASADPTPPDGVAGYAFEINADAGASLTIDQLTGTDGYLSANSLLNIGSVLKIGTVTGTNNDFDVETGSTLVFTSTVPGVYSALDDEVYGGGTVAFDHPTAVNNIYLTEVAVGETIEVPGKMVENVTFGSNTLDIQTNAGNYLFDAVDYAAQPGNPDQDPTPTPYFSGYTTSFDSTTGLAAVTFACYLRGTRILADTGEAAIETLSIGRRVQTVDGCYRPIKWIGRRTYAGHTVWADPKTLPILIRKGALDDGVPRRDLYVSPLHAMYLDGMLIAARDLANGSSIVQLERADSVEYFHIELEAHGVIFAEGAASESFVDDHSRDMFDNVAEFHRLYPTEVRTPAQFYAPRVEDGWELERVRQRLALRAAHVAAFGDEGRIRAVVLSRPAHRACRV